MDLKVEIEDMGGLKKALLVEVAASELAEDIKAGFEALKATAEVEGFRKGKVPETVIKQKFGKDVLEDVSKHVIAKSYPEALKLKGLKAIAAPKVDVVRLSEGSPFIYRAMIDIMPTVSQDTYIGIKVKPEPTEVTDAEIDQNIDMLRGRNANFKDSDGEAADGDQVTIAVDCLVDGKPLAASDGQKKDYTFEVGQGASLPEFEELSVGAKAGETRDFKKTFPIAYHDKNVAGKVAEFKITIKSVKKKELAPVDDDLAKDLGCADLADLMSKVRIEVTSLKENNERDRVKKEILDKILEVNDFEVPETLENKYYTQLMSNMMDGVRSGKINPLGYDASSQEAKERYRNIAQTQAKSDIVLDVIADNEGIDVSTAEIDQAIVNIAKSRGESPDKVRAALEEKKAIGILTDSIMRDKVFDKLMGTELETAG
ncbi:Cell division trigger factor [hydrothermal vent metagenome]|uniref:peptidylprolyl isomerase n=1 Tax=hydrothermal vent metagenome TaxID=652676 RepID=A0A3B0RL90_9ZZZZ